MPADGSDLAAIRPDTPQVRPSAAREFLSRLRSGIVSLLALAILGLTCATLIGHFGGGLWLFDLFSHFRCQYVVLALVCGCLLGLLQSWKMTGIALVVSIWNAWFVAPLYRSVSQPDVPVEWRLVSVNAFSRNQTPDALLAFLRHEQPDAFVVVELSPALADHLSALDELYPYREFEVRSDNFGIGLYSRLPIVNAELIPLAVGLPAVVAEIQKSGRKLTIIGAHPVPPAGRRLSEQRNQQLQQLGELAADIEGDCVLLGDLNTTPWSSSFQELLQESSLKDGRMGFGVSPTWPAGRPWLSIPIDHCLASEELTVRRFAIGPDIGSDHYPVLVELGDRSAAQHGMQ